ncbi:5'-nucleotidase domain-containing protein 1 [Erpetoichthys calabaricus]|uniref:5'-nucleotidase domain-containing protein 1 n=1 Tax=Erpetoichthys calabaricus TaxID=27687 RepID=UPI00109F4428|nr:5'-nucleotidase domain-containing protein 1 [Erpetoichthys calabaricus]
MCDVFSLTECDVIGFDLDHTLCRYHLQETCRLLFESLAKYLVEHKGYDKDLLNITTEGWDFCFKGLVLDFEEGNLIKLAEDGTILRATHGTKNLSTNEIVQHYGKERKWKHFNNLNGTFTRSAKYYFYDNYFDLPGALLFARVVDLLQKNGNQTLADFSKDLISAIDHNYNISAFKENSGTFFPSVKQDPGKYLQRCPDSVKAWLQNLKNSGKVLLLITSSHSDYCRLVCEHILGHNFEDFFDIIITNALKPGFFSQIPNQRPFRNLVNDIEDCNGLASLDKPGWYSQGNWTHLNDLLKKMTRKSTPKVVYFGDSMRSDVFPASHYGNWDVVLILEELESEVIEENEVNSKDISAEPLEKKGKYEEQSIRIPSATSHQWGSYFLDDYKGINELEETQKYTWCCSCITTYSTIAIPSIEAIAELPLDFKFQRFSSHKPRTVGYYPKAPISLMKSRQKE